MNDRLHDILKKIASSRSWRFISRNRQIRWLFTLTFVILVLVVIISIVEVRSNEAFDSYTDIFYWALITITTVGYGDITPRTPIGQFFTVFMVLAGVILVSFMTATIASILTATRIREGMGLKKVDLTGHIVICGFNFKIESVLRSIISASEMAPPELVLVNTHSEAAVNDLIERFPEAPIRFVHGDYTLESSLDRASISKASSAIILADPGEDGQGKADDRTLIALLAIKSMAPEVRVCVELLEDSSEVHLRRAGVDQIILSGEFSGFLLANAVMSPGLPQAMKEMMVVGLGSDIRRRKLPADLVGKTFREAAFDFFDRFGMILVGVVTEKKSFNMDTILTADNSAIDDFIRRKFEEAGRSLQVESKGLITVRINPGKDYVISEDDNAIVITSKQEKTVI